MTSTSQFSDARNINSVLEVITRRPRHRPQRFPWLALFVSISLAFAACGQNGQETGDGAADPDAAEDDLAFDDDSDDASDDEAGDDDTEQSDADSSEVATNGDSDSDDDVELLIETWNSGTVPVFENFTSEISPVVVTYVPSESSQFDADLLARLESGTAGDVIACRPYDRSQSLFEAGYLADLSDMETPRIPDFAYTAWTSESGARYCIPVSSVALGFLYNERIFDELSLQPPTDIASFEAILTAIEQDGRYVPLALGSENPSRLGNLLFGNVGPAFWGGESGRTAIASGDVPFADSGMPELLELVARWERFLPDGHELVDPSSSAEMFTLGDAAIVPAGSWMIPALSATDEEIGAFPSPGLSSGDSCVVVSPLDLAVGMNPATEHPELVAEFLQHVAGEEFGATFVEMVDGQFSLQEPLPPKTKPLDESVASWSVECDRSLRFSDTGYGEAASDIQQLTWELSVDLVQGALTPEQAADRLEEAIGNAATP